MERFERQADEGPQLDAIRHLDRSASRTVSFGELDSWANAIACELIARRGTRPEPVPLVVCAPELMLAAALGTLKAGKFYVAVNPLHPPPRVRRVLDEFDAPLLMCDSGGKKAVPSAACALSLEQVLAARPFAERPDLCFDERRLAYVLYTSGSTGRPQGVAQSRRDMLHNVARHRPLGIGRGDCVSLISADGFVASVSNPYVALLSGAALAPYSFRDEGVDRMIDWFDAAGVTVLYAFPSFLRQLAAAEPERVHDRLRLVYLGGETVLPADLASARRLFPTAELSVGLNSSETGLTCLHLIPPGATLPAPVPAGRPALDVSVSIVNERGAPVPVGASGEIEISSMYVNPRYWVRGSAPEENAHTPDGGMRLVPFRTKDRGRIDADGIVHHLGRVDGMVKIRGFRVEIAEVESAIGALDGVADVEVFPVSRGSGTSELVACVVEQSEGVDGPSMRAALTRELPAAMVPARVLVVQALPRTGNGKLDRRELARLDGNRLTQPCPEPEGPTTVERLIAGIWRSVIDVPRIGADDDFFMLGGTSLDAVAVVVEMSERFGVRIPLRTLFRTPTVRALAQAVVATGAGARNGVG